MRGQCICKLHALMHIAHLEIPACWECMARRAHGAGQPGMWPVRQKSRLQRQLSLSELRQTACGVSCRSHQVLKCCMPADSQAVASSLHYMSSPARFARITEQSGRKQFHTISVSRQAPQDACPLHCHGQPRCSRYAPAQIGNPDVSLMLHSWIREAPSSCRERQQWS